MRVNNKRYKLYKKEMDYRKLRHRLKRNQKSKSFAPIRPPKKGFYNLPAPINFSLINNPENCIKYFNDALELINQYQLQPITDTVQFEISEIEYLTIDAIMYQLAIMTNLRAKTRNIKIVRGTMPKKEDIKKMLIESGFLSYVKTPEAIAPKQSTKTTEIMTGEIVDGESIGKIIDFVNNYFKNTTQNTKFLYTLLSELMTNTKDHAYDQEEENEFTNRWYLYADVEEENDKIKITFLDTGYGIPNTVRKKLEEKIKDAIFKEKTDAEYIYSALKGEFRTATKQKHRGEGLPFINECVEKGRIKNLKIISSYGMINVLDNKINIENIKYLKNSLPGTLYYWEMDRECMRGE